MSDKQNSVVLQNDLELGDGPPLPFPGASVTGYDADTIPSPPWHLAGSAVAMFSGVRPASGVLLALVHYDESPVGAYDELARAGLTRRGPSVLEMFVNSPASMVGGRRGWGFPKQLADLQWRQRGAHQRETRVTFRAGSSVWRIRACGPSFPLCLRGWTVQTLEGESVQVPVRIRGHARLGFNGKRLAILLEGMEMDVLPPQPLRDNSS